MGDWVKYKRSIKSPTYGWQGANQKSVGFVQSVPDKDNLIVSFCSGEKRFQSGEARVLANEVVKLIPLDRGQHVQLKPEVKEPRFRSFYYFLFMVLNKYQIQDQLLLTLAFCFCCFVLESCTKIF